MSATAILPAWRDGRSELARWLGAGALVLAAHAGIVAAYWWLGPSAPPGAEDAPAVIVDLAPLTVAPQIEQQDLAPGPQTPPPQPQAAAPPQPQPQPKAIEPPQPEIVPQLPPAPVAPLVALPEPKPKAAPEPKRKTLEQPRKPAPPPRPQTAPPKAERTARAPAAARAGSRGATAVPPDWLARLLAQLNRSKRYPPAARSRREQGVVTLAFTLSRDGRVLARHIARSSGSQALDAEALAMLQRAERLPAFPADMGGASRSFSVPIRFSLR